MKQNIEKHFLHLETACKVIEDEIHAICRGTKFQMSRNQMNQIIVIYILKWL